MGEQAYMQQLSKPQTCSFFAFNTINTVQVCSATDARDAFAAVQEKARFFERLFSHTLPESSLVRLNAAGGVPVEVEPELAELVCQALRYCEATDGLFDITLGPVVELWSMGQVPARPGLEAALTHVDWRKVHVEGNTVQLEDSAAQLVLGGIAKGYIADALVALLQRHGAEHGLVNLGGNVKVFGGKPNGVPWSVGLRVPRASSEVEEAAFAAVELADGSVVTSGIYERGVHAEDGTFYHHILDPRTGMPAETDLVSASLISETSLDGDGYTTALIVMGLQRAFAFVEALPGCEAVFVDANGHVYTTSGVGTTVPFRLL